MKIKCFNDESLRQLADSVNGEVSALASAVADAVSEIYENMDVLEKSMGCTYVEGEEMIVLPQGAGAAGITVIE